MARMSLSQAAQSVAGKQPVQPVPLVGNPYSLSPALASQVAAGESFLRNNMSAVPARRMSPPSPTPGSNAYRIAAPVGTFYNPNGQRDGRAIGVQTGFGAYPVINTRNPTMVVLPPRLDLFSHMQNDYANFYRNMLPFITQMSQRAMQQGAKAARPRVAGAGGPTKPKAQLQQPPSGPMGPFFDDRDSFRLRQPGVRPDYKISPPAPGWQPWQMMQNPTASDDYAWYRDNHKTVPPAAGTSSAAGTPPADSTPPLQGRPFIGATKSYEGPYSPPKRYAYEDWKDTLKGIIDSPGSPIDAAINSFFQGVKKYFQ